MNATDQREYILQGFKDLQKRISGVDDDAETRKRIRANTAAREAAMARVAAEYGALGLTPPSDLALSVTARRELGIGIEYAEAAE